MIYGYIRIDKEKQDFHQQKNTIENYKNRNISEEKIKLIKEKKDIRIEYKNRDISKMINRMKKKDILIIQKIDRLGKTKIEILTILKRLLERKIILHTIKEKWIIDKDEMILAFEIALKIDDDLYKKMIKTKVDNIKEEIDKNGYYITRAGKRINKLGRPGGIRKSKLDKDRDKIKKMIDDGIAKKIICNKFGCARTTLDNFLKNHLFS